MKSNIVILWLLTTYFIVVAAAYVIWNFIATARIEWVGSLAILLSAGLTGLIAFFLMLVVKKQGGQLVEDLPQADIDDGDPEIGDFSPWSWWPFSLAGGLALVAIGMATGTLETWFWFAIFGLPVVVVSLVGWIYEYYRGNFAR